MLRFLLYAFLIWYLTIPSPAQKRWETYCYPEGSRAQIVTLAQAGGYDLQFLNMPDGQPGWWYLRGEGYSEERPCLLMHYWYTSGKKGWPYAEFIRTGKNHCCTQSGF